jgi:DNA-binding MarR family transcriptional regulator
MTSEALSPGEVGTQVEAQVDGSVEGSVEVDPRRRLVDLAAAFASGYQRWLESSTPSSELSFPRLRLLELLHCQGPQMMRALADELGLTPRNVTALVDALESEGLVRRVAHPSDRRATLVESTPAGVDAAERTLVPKLSAIGELFDDLSPCEQDQLAALLSVLVDALRRRGQRV